MKKMNRKGFTIVELVIVIAIVAVLAAVLIPTFSTIIKKANDSAYLQDRTNQQIADMAEKLATQNEQYLTWEDFEAKLAEQLAATNEDMTTAISKALEEYNAAYGNNNTALTEDQVKVIIEKALEGQLTTAQVQAIVEVALKDTTLTTDQVEAIVNVAVKDLQDKVGNVGINKEQMEKAIKDAMATIEGVSSDELNKAISDAIEKLGDSALTADQIQQIIDAAVANADPGSSDELAAKRMSAILATKFATPTNSLEEVVKHLKANGYNVNNKFAPHTTGNIFYWHKGTNEVIVAPEDSHGADYIDLKTGASYIKVEAKTSDEAINALNDGFDVTLGTNVTLPETVISISGDVLIDLNGYNIDTNDNVGRPFELNKGATLTIDASKGNSEIDCGKYGIVKINGVSNATLVINGGTFKGELDAGAFIKVAQDSENAKITLNNVNFVDSGKQNIGKNSFIVNMQGAHDVEIVVNGGKYESALGFHASKLTLDGVTIVTDSFAATATKSLTVNNCNITSYGKYERDVIPTQGGTTHGACVAISSGGVATVTNSTLTYDDKYSSTHGGGALLVLSSGGKIIVDSETKITGEEYYNTVNSAHKDYDITVSYIEIAGSVKLNLEYKKAQ